MINKALITLASIATISNGAKQYAATFANNDISGTVTVDNGHVVVDIDLSAEPALPTNFSFCTEGGMSWHIHEIWTYVDDDDRLAGDCGADYTAGHYDPWNACGPASGNDYCTTDSTTASNGMCIPKTDYSSAFMPEIGDWSGMYGKLELTSANKLMGDFSSYYEVLPSELMGKSIVFHCNNGDRAFCAPFLETTTVTSKEIPGQGSSKSVAAYFDVLGPHAEITITSTGTLLVHMDLDYAEDTITAAGCTSFDFGIFNPGDMTLEASKLGSECDGYVGDQYDPTHQCLPWSDSPYCDMGELCDDANYTYSCDFTSDRYSCAPGDLSGKHGMIDTTEAGDHAHIELNGTHYLLPPSDSLMDMVMAIYCPYDESSPTTRKYLACSIIGEEHVNHTDHDHDHDHDGIARLSFIVSFILAFIAFLY